MSDQKGFSLVEALLIIVLVSVISFAGYFAYSRQNSGEKAYLEAYENGLSLKPNQQAYMSFDLRSEVSHLKGESQGELIGKNNKHRATYTGNTTYNGTPFSMTLDVIGIYAPDKSESYTRIRDVSSKDPEVNKILQQSYKDVLNNWEFNDEDVADEYEQSTFKDNGIFAAWDVSGFFVPSASFDQSDRKATMKALESHMPYSVDGKVEHVQFKGQSARKLTVGLNKDAFKKYGEAANKVVSKKAGWQVTNSTLIDEFFAGKPEFSANVYLDNNENKIIGVETKIRLAAPIKDSMIDEDFQNVQTTFFIDYSRDLHIGVPQVNTTGEQI